MRRFLTTSSTRTFPRENSAEISLVLYKPPVFSWNSSLYSTLLKLLKFTAATFIVGSAISYKYAPKEGYIRKSFDREFYREDALSRERMKWVFILLCTGFSTALSSNDRSFDTLAGFVHFWMEYKHTTAFRNATPGELFFRGDFDPEPLLMGKNRSPLPFSTFDWTFSMPSIVDSTLSKEGEPGFSNGVIALSKDMRVAMRFGGEKVLIIAPHKGRRVAPVSQHIVSAEKSDDEHPFCSDAWWMGTPKPEYEYVCGGIHASDVFGVARAEFFEDEKDPKNSRDKFVEFTINSNFKGDIRQLKLDEQMRPLINLLPETDPRKEILLRKINDADDRAEYRSLLSETADEHRKRISERLAKISTSGFNGNPICQTFFKMTVAKQLEKIFSEKKEIVPRF